MRSAPFGNTGLCLGSVLVVSGLFLSGCASMFEPLPPLWEEGRFNTVVVLPIRMEVSTGAPPFTTPDTDISNRTGGAMQEALSIIFVSKGYDVLAPLDANERLGSDSTLTEAFMDLALRHGLAPGEAAIPPEEENSPSPSGLLADGLGADLLVLAHGDGEYHSFSEALMQGVLTGIITGGKHQSQSPPSVLRARVIFLDPKTDSIVASFHTGDFPFSDKSPSLANTLGYRFRRVPQRHEGGPGTPSEPPVSP